MSDADHAATGTTPHRVVVVGGGFGGFSAARRLTRRRSGPIEVTVVNESNSLTYTPFLPQAASGMLEPRHAVVPLRAALPRARLCLAAVVSHDRAKRTVGIEGDSGAELELPYDQLIVSPGSVTRSAPVPGLLESAYGFKTMAQAIQLRNHVLRRVEAATLLEDPAERDAQLTFVFIGGGYAGVEALAELEDMVDDVLSGLGSADLRPRWHLIEATERILPEVGSRLSKYAHRQLESRGIRLWLGTTIDDASGGAITLSSGERIECRTLVWTAGVRPHPIVAELGFPTDDDGRIRVDETLAVTGHDGVWALGDAASVPDPARPGEVCPPSSQHAVRQGTLAAENVLALRDGRDPEPFTYKTKGRFVDLGRNKAVADMLGIRFAGPLAWFVGRTYHLSQVPGLSRKTRVAADWTLQLFFPRDTAELGALQDPQELLPPADS